MIENFVKNGLDSFASIAYSILLKLNIRNDELYKTLSLNGLAIAKRLNDPIHKMARANNLADLYARKKPGSSEHLKYLKEVNKALKDICKNYSTNLNSRYCKISRGVKPLENYELMLCSIKLDIAKYTMKNDKQSALYELEEARNLLNKNANSKINTESLKAKLDKLDKQLKNS